MMLPSVKTKTKERIKARDKDVVIIAVKKIEAWFLADNAVMSVLLNVPDFSFENHENEQEPFETINNLLIVYAERGIGKKSAGKIKLVTKLLELGLDISLSAQHPDCSSAKYFIDKLKQISL